MFRTSHNPAARPWSVQYGPPFSGGRRAAKKQRNVRPRNSRPAIGGKVFTAIEPLARFYMAEGYHQKNYLRRDYILMREYSEMFPERDGFVNSPPCEGQRNSCGTGFEGGTENDFFRCSVFRRRRRKTPYQGRNKRILRMERKEEDEDCVCWARRCRRVLRRPKRPGHLKAAVSPGWCFSPGESISGHHGQGAEGAGPGRGSSQGPSLLPTIPLKSEQPILCSLR